MVPACSTSSFGGSSFSKIDFFHFLCQIHCIWHFRISSSSSPHGGGRLAAGGASRIQSFRNSSKHKVPTRNACSSIEKTSQLRLRKALGHERHCSQNSCSDTGGCKPTSPPVHGQTLSHPFEVKCQHHSAAWDSSHASSSPLS